MRADLVYWQGRLLAEEAGAPRLELITPHNITVAPGESQDVTLTLRNVGSRAMHSLFSVAVPSANAPFTVEFLQNSNSVSQIGVNAQREMTIRVTVNENAATGPHTISLNHFFEDHLRRPGTSSDVINVRITDELGTPSLEIRGMTPPAAAVSVGQTGTFRFELHNTGDAETRDIRVAVVLPTEITPINQGNNISVPAIPAGESREVSFDLRPTAAASTRAYDIQFSVSYGAGDAARTFSQFSAMNVYNPDDDGTAPTLEIRDITVPTGNVNVGQTGTIRFYVHNSGDAEVRNIRVTATPTAAVVPTTQNPITIPTVAAGESRPVTFTFRPTDAAATQFHNIQLAVAQVVGEAAVPLFSQHTGFNVYNPDDENGDGDRTLVPRVMVSEHIVYPAIPRAGQEFDLTITFRNTSSTVGVSNISINLTEAAGAAVAGQAAHTAGFSPVTGSDTLFLESLAPLQEVTKTLRYTTSMEATPGIHNMRVTFDYQDQHGNVVPPVTQLITIPLAQVTRLEIHNLNMPEWSSVGSSIWFSFQIINSGRVGLESVRVRIEGPFDLTDAHGEQGRFIGRIPAQRMASTDGRLVPWEAGNIQGNIIITGEDSTGAEVELIQPFFMFVDEGFGFGDDWFGGDEWHGGGRPMPGFPGMPGFDDDEEDDANIFVRAFRAVFTREVYVAPEWWEEEWHGEFTAENARMMGIFPDVGREVRLLTAILIPIGVLALAVGIPVIVIVKKRKNRLLDFDDED